MAAGKYTESRCIPHGQKGLRPIGRAGLSRHQIPETMPAALAHQLFHHALKFALPEGFIQHDRLAQDFEQQRAARVFPQKLDQRAGRDVAPVVVDQKDIAQLVLLDTCAFNGACARIDREHRGCR